MITPAVETPRAGSVTLIGRGTGELAFLDFGDQARPIDAIFVHANGFNALTYRRLLAPLAGKHRIVAIDQRGHGASTLDATPSGPRDWTDLRDDLLAFLAALDLREVVLAGHSMGATVSLLAAGASPESCRQLVLFDPVVLPPERANPGESSIMVQAAAKRRSTFSSRIDAFNAYKGRGAFKSWPDEVLRDYIEAGFHDVLAGGVTLACRPEWEASGFLAQGHDPWEAFRATCIPIDILRAESGSTFHPDEGSALDWPRVRVSTPPGTTHFLPMERPETARRCLSRAIAGTRAITLDGAIEPE